MDDKNYQYKLVVNNGKVEIKRKPICCINKDHDLIIDYPQLDNKKCYECGKELSNNDGWSEFREIKGYMYKVKICNECSDPMGITQRQINMKNKFKNILIKNNLYKEFCNKYLNLDEEKYHFDNLKQPNGSENWNEYIMISFNSWGVNISKVSRLKHNIHGKFGYRSNTLENKVLNLLLKNGFIIKENKYNKEKEYINLEMENLKNKVAFSLGWEECNNKNK